MIINVDHLDVKNSIYTCKDVNMMDISIINKENEICYILILQYEVNEKCSEEYTEQNDLYRIGGLVYNTDSKNTPIHCVHSKKYTSPNFLHIWQLDLQTRLTNEKGIVVYICLYFVA